MYYRKYFSGTLANYSDRATVPIAGTALTMSVFANQTDLLNNAIATTLTAAGVDCVYNSTNKQLVVNKMPISILYTAAMQVSIFSGSNTAVIAGSSGAQYQPFNNADYKFYVTVRGDKKNCFDVYWGTNSAPAGIQYGFRILEAYNKYYNEEIVCLCGPGSASTMWPRSRDGNLYRSYAYNASMACASYLYANNEFTQNGGIVPLIPAYTNDGFILLKECYLRPSDLQYNNFYNVAGDLYYVVNGNFMVKCNE